MTVKQLFEFALIELNKIEAPSLLLEDYNYFINKAILQYINKIYNKYDINQQSTDDVRHLNTSIVIPLIKKENIGITSLNNSHYAVLPKDYLHLLNCVVEYTVTKDYKCYKKTENVLFGAKRLIGGLFSQIINNHYMKPLYKRPYYYINNQQVVLDSTTNEYLIEIRSGAIDIFSPSKIYIDYIKYPKRFVLLQEDLEKTEDVTEDLGFSEYVCIEILNEFVKLLMENMSDPRLQTNIPVNQTIAQPQPQQPQQQQQQR